MQGDLRKNYFNEVRVQIPTNTIGLTFMTYVIYVDPTKKVNTNKSKGKIYKFYIFYIPYKKAP